MSQHILFFICLVVWFALRIHCELIGQQMLDRLKQENQTVDFKTGPFSFRLLQYASMMSQYKALLIAQGEDTRSVKMFWITFSAMMMVGAATLWFSIDLL